MKSKAQKAVESLQKAIVAKAGEASADQLVKLTGEWLRLEERRHQLLTKPASAAPQTRTIPPELVPTASNGAGQRLTAEDLR